MGIVVEHDVKRDDLALGAVWVAGTSVRTPEALFEALTHLIEERRADLSPTLEERRKECRDILRNGVYKPTGRGKPASEYLLRAARDGTFPRINGLVDANNLVSLKTLMPISLWDVERAGAREYAFRLGAPEQRYVFNPAGHEMDLQDLVCGGTLNDHVWSPLVNPIKDSMATKTTDQTTEVAAVIYAPASAVADGSLDTACEELERLLESCALSIVDGSHGVISSGESLRLGKKV